jgi:hypothetical protein
MSHPLKKRPKKEIAFALSSQQPNVQKHIQQCNQMPF